MKVDFERLHWENYPSTETPINADNLNRLEEGVAGLYSDVAEIEQELGGGVGEYVTDWLNEHVDPVGSAVVVDNTLSIAGAAADAKKTGDELASLGSRKVAQPLDEYNQPTNGISGQLLRTKGNGTTEWVDDGLPTDEQTVSAVSAWLDGHPEATTTVQDGSLTEVKLIDSLQKKTIKDYVTPQMFGAVADALYYNSGAWYKDAEFTQLSTDNSVAFQRAIDSKMPVLVPKGHYYLSSPIYINYGGARLCGTGAEESDSFLHFHDTNGIVVASGYRLISIENLGIHNDARSCAGIEISKQSEDIDPSVHYLTIRNVLIFDFKYGIIAGGRSETEVADGGSYLWNCAFRDIKISTFDHDTTTGIRIFYNRTSNFANIFENVYINGCNCALRVEATRAVYINCNFGINATNAVSLTDVSEANFIRCNFECDKLIDGTQYSALINSTYKTSFTGCSFGANTSQNVSFISGGTLSSFVFNSCRYIIKTGNMMVDFFAKNLQSGKSSIVYIGGNADMPRPDTYAKHKIQLLDLERSILPLRPANAEVQTTEYAGQLQFDVAVRTGGRPVWYDGSSWKGSPRGEWKYFDAVDAGASVTYNIDPYDDRPRTALITVRGHSTDLYAVGIAVLYRGASSAVFVPMHSANCTVSITTDSTLTITNNTNGVRYMYLSIIDLI